MRQQTRPIITSLGHRFPDLSLEQEALDPLGYEVLSAPQYRPDDASLQLALEHSVAILLGTQARVDGTLMERLTECRVIVRYGIGVDNVDLESARRHKITVSNVPDYCIEEVATHAVAMALALQRQLPTLAAHLLQGGWGGGAAPLPRRPSTQVLGIVGMGRIGREVARQARMFGSIVAYDPYAPESLELPQGVGRRADLDELLALSDVVSLHCPLTDETRHIVDAQALSLMKPSAFLLNVSRGGLVDERALLEALDTGKLAGAGLDVFEDEPPRTDHPLIRHPRVLATPHVAWRSQEAAVELRRKAVDEAIRVLQGKSPNSAVVTPE